MKSRCGHFRRLTDREIRKVLMWHQEAVEFRHSHGTVRDLASLLGVSLDVVRGCFESRSRGTSKGSGVAVYHSLTRRGRPRHLKPAQIAFALAWRNRGREFRARHGSIASLAHELGVGASTIHDCIRRKGRYVQRSAADACKARNSRRTHLPISNSALRAALLRAWSRPKPKT
jgi:hypothetical protein